MGKDLSPHLTSPHLKEPSIDRPQPTTNQEVQT